MNPNSVEVEMMKEKERQVSELAEKEAAKEVSCDESVRINDLARRMFIKGHAAGYEKGLEDAALMVEKFWRG